jgi:hypothetical protein
MYFRRTEMLTEEISEFGLLIADEDGYESWRRRQIELEEQYYEQYEEEERLDRKERARDINSVGKHYY